MTFNTLGFKNWDFYYAWVQMLLQMGPLLHLGPVITLVPSIPETGHRSVKVNGVSASSRLNLEKI